MSCHFEEHDFVVQHRGVCLFGYIGEHFRSVVCVICSDYGKHMTNQNKFETMTQNIIDRRRSFFK